MWVFCCGMQRSGSTLQYQIAARLVEQAGLGQRLEWVEPGRFPELRDRYADVPGLKVFKNHVCTDAMAAEFARGNAVGIYSYRDPRDVFVSNMRKYACSFEVLWCGGFLETSLLNYRRWTGLPRVLVSRYESMIGDLPAEVQRIAAHLGIEVDAQACRRLAEEHTMEKQRQRQQIERPNDGLIEINGQTQIKKADDVEQHRQRRDVEVVGLGSGQQARDGVGDERDGNQDGDAKRAEDDPLQPRAPQQPGPEERLSGNEEDDGVMGIEGQPGQHDIE